MKNKFSDIISSIYNKFISLQFIFFPNSIQKEFKRWIKDGGDYNNRFNYPLQKNSIVFDVGGFEGQFASDIYSRTPCNIFVFEPVAEYAFKISERFKFNTDIKTFDFGLSNSNKKSKIYLLGDASSTERNINFYSSDQQKIKLVDFIDFVNDRGIDKIDLLKINIEGGEYNLLRHIIDNNYHTKIKYLQIQFHKINENSVFLKNQIQNDLSETHNCLFNYEFIWENWIIKDIDKIE